MSRRTTQTFQCHPLDELTRQLLFAPPERRVEQVRRVETLHDQIDPDLDYPFDFLSYRITGYRSESTKPMLLIGRAVLPDLRLMIDRLSYSASMPVTDDEPVESPGQLATRLGVSTKTIGRWRELGLRWRWVTQHGKNRKTVVFTTSAVEQFVAKHTQRIDSASRRTHIDAQTRQRLIDRARRIARATSASLNAVAAHLAKKTHRAHQTIRLILEQYDRDHPDNRIFIDRTAPLNAHDKRRIARAYRLGMPISQIARRYGRTRSTIYRAIRHRRAAVLRRVRIFYTTCPAFDRKSADELFLPPIKTQTRSRDRQITIGVDDLPPPLQGLYRGPATPSANPQSRLLQLNYLKYKAAKLRKELDRYDPRAADLDQIESYIRTAGRLRTRLVIDSLPVVLSVARRHLIDQDDRSTALLVELLEIGTAQTIRAIERYDVSRRQTLGAYLTWSLMRRFLEHQSAHNPSGTIRAHRKLDPDSAWRRICNAAASGGVKLEITDPPA